jgi:hypothetical protein
MDTAFSLSSLLVMPLWALMIFAPLWRVTRTVMQFTWVIAPAALLYAVLVLPNIGSVLPAVSTPNLEGIRALLSSQSGATIAWVHFLAFDLFVGRWAYLESRALNLNVFAMAVVLFLTLMLGPVGALLYLGLRLTARGATREAVKLEV